MAGIERSSLMVVGLYDYVLLGYRQVAYSRHLKVPSVIHRNLLITLLNFVGTKFCELGIFQIWQVI